MKKYEISIVYSYQAQVIYGNIFRVIWEILKIKDYTVKVKSATKDVSTRRREGK